MLTKVKRVRWRNIEDELSSGSEAAFDEAERLYEETFKTFEEGAVIPGVVIAIETDSIIVDVGYKSTATIPREEFSKETLATLKVGESLPVFLEGLEDEEGNLLLSKEKADKMKVWEEIERIYKEDGILEGKVLSQIKGGVIIDIGVKAFMPGSQIDFRPARDMGALVGKTFSVKIVKMSVKAGNIVVSRRAVLEKTRDQKRNSILSTIKEGQVVEGIVKNITDYGAFIDLGGIDGLLHITDIAWSRVGHPSEHLKVGEKHAVVILKYDKETSRVSLGLKQRTADPWDAIDIRYPVGAKVSGRVVNLADYGAFVEIEPGVEGLVHVSDLTWTREVKHPSKVVAIGEAVQAVILNIDRKARKLSLGMKQAEPNPWDQAEEKYPAGMQISGKIKSITDFGVFVGLEERIDGLIHVSDISWTRHVKHPSEVFKKGQDIEAVVLKVDRKKERISLGYKQLTADPWMEMQKSYAVGAVVKGRVSKLTDFGFFVELPDGIEGLIHLSETGLDSAERVSEIYPTSTEVRARVIRLDATERKVALSLREVPPAEETT
jgi:small subunit ribosomal protein S1